MATNVTAEQINEAYETALKSREKWLNFRKAASAKIDETAREMLGILETGAAAYGVGLVRGAYGEIKILKMPYEILLTTGLHLSAFGGLFGRQTAHVHAVANGVLGGYLGLLGMSHGASMKQTSGAVEIVGATGQTVRRFENYTAPGTRALNYSPGRAMSREELDALSVGDMGEVE